MSMLRFTIATSVYGKQIYYGLDTKNLRTIKRKGELKSQLRLYVGGRVLKSARGN